MNPVDVSIILLTYNGIDYIDEVLQAIFQQKTSYYYELIVIDSGSSDGTAETAKKYPVHFIAIDKTDFSHSKTRNYGAALAHGKFLVFLTQDATPAHEYWLEELISGFQLDPLVVCVFGRHIARHDCDPITKRDLNLHFNSFAKTDPLLQYVPDTDEGRKKYRENPLWYGFNSNVNSALRKDIWEKFKFRDVIYTEDQLIGRDIILNGYKKVYVPQASVCHSHKYSKKSDYLKRFFDEYRGMEIAFDYKDDINLLNLIPATIKATLSDAAFILKQAEGDLFRKIYWIYYRGWINLYHGLGAYLGGRHRRLPRFLRKWLSLEKNPG